MVHATYVHMYIQATLVAMALKEMMSNWCKKSVISLLHATSIIQLSLNDIYCKSTAACLGVIYVN